MLPQTFISQAMRTDSDVTGTFDVNPKTIHSILGFISEIKEFCDAIDARDTVNMVEELGDVMWFAALFTDTNKINIDIFSERDMSEFGPIDSMGNLADLLKCMYAYGGKKDRSIETLKQDIAKTMGDTIYALLKVVSTNLSIDPVTAAEKAQALVINKLKARYPDKFKTQHALRRDLGYENEVMKQSLEG